MPLTVDGQTQTSQDWDATFLAWRNEMIKRGECYLAETSEGEIRVLSVPLRVPGDAPDGLVMLVRCWRQHPRYDRLAVLPPPGTTQAEYEEWFRRDLWPCLPDVNRVRYTSA